MAEGFVTRRGGTSKEVISPSISLVSKTNNQIVVTFTNNDPETAIIIYEIGDTTPDSNTLELNSGQTSSQITFSSLSEDTTYTIYATAFVNEKIPVTNSLQETTYRLTSNPTLTNPERTIDSITFTINNTHNFPVTAYYEIGDTTPDANTVSISASGSETVTISGLDDDVSYTTYVYTLESGQLPSSTVSINISTLENVFQTNRFTNYNLSVNSSLCGTTYAGYNVGGSALFFSNDGLLSTTYRGYYPNRQYYNAATLNTAYDIDSRNTPQGEVQKSSFTQVGYPSNVYISFDGLHAYMNGYTNSWESSTNRNASKDIHLTLGTPFNLRDIVSKQELLLPGVPSNYWASRNNAQVSIDGTYFATIKRDASQTGTTYQNQRLYQYNLSTPYDLSTATQIGTYIDLKAIGETVNGSSSNTIWDQVYFTNDGNQLVVSARRRIGNYDTDTGEQFFSFVFYDLSTPYDLSTRTRQGEYYLGSLGSNDLRTGIFAQTHPTQGEPIDFSDFHIPHKVPKIFMHRSRNTYQVTCFD